jgi:hypothetical protein
MTQEDQSVFKVYYRQNYGTDNTANVVLPNQQTPHKTYRDHKPILQVDNIDYSHKYGGSVVIQFELTDFYDDADEANEIIRVADYGYEFTYLEYTYDIQDLVIRVYVVPRLSHFNPSVNFHVVSPANELHVEILPRNLVAYKNGGIINSFYTSPDYQIFKEYIQRWEESLTKSLRGGNKTTSLYIFAHAFAHYMHSGLLPPLTEKVTNLFVTDGWFDLTSEIYEGLAAVSWKIQGIDLWQGVWEDDFEIKVSYRVKYLHGGFKKEVASGELELGTYEDSYYIPIGIFNNTDLEEISGIEIEVKIKEEDRLGDEKYETINILFDVADEIVRPRISSATAGVVGDGLIIYDHEYLAGSEEVEGSPGLYKLDHDLYERGREDTDSDSYDGYMDSYLRIAIIKR